MSEKTKNLSEGGEALAKIAHILKDANIPTNEGINIKEEDQGDAGNVRLNNSEDEELEDIRQEFRKLDEESRKW